MDISGESRQKREESVEGGDRPTEVMGDAELLYDESLIDSWPATGQWNPHVSIEEKSPEYPEPAYFTTECAGVAGCP